MWTDKDLYGSRRPSGRIRTFEEHYPKDVLRAAERVLEEAAAIENDANRVAVPRDLIGNLRQACRAARGK